MKKFIIALLAFSPSLAFAATATASGPNLSYFTGFIESIQKLINLALPLIVGLALVAFFWGVGQIIWGGDDAKKAGKIKIIWGIVGLFVMVSVWGLVGFLGSILGVGAGSTNNQNSAVVPTVETTVGGNILH
jgi:hypothetical protein